MKSIKHVIAILLSAIVSQSFALQVSDLPKNISCHNDSDAYGLVRCDVADENLKLFANYTSDLDERIKNQNTLCGLMGLTPPTRYDLTYTRVQNLTGEIAYVFDDKTQSLTETELKSVDRSAALLVNIPNSFFGAIFGRKLVDNLETQLNPQIFTSFTCSVPR